MTSAASLTAADICSLAAQVAKCPGFTTQAGQSLNLVLDDLCLHRDLKVNRVQTFIVVASGTNGPFDFEDDYLRTYDLFFLQNGLPYFLRPASNKLYDLQFKDPSIANYPYMWTSQLNDQGTVGGKGQLFIYPQSSGSITLTHRYMIERPLLTNPSGSTEVPWFSDQDYLVKATATRLMQITDDTRYSRFVQECLEMLRPHLIMEGDEQAVVHAVELDPWKFRNNRYLRPTKLTD